MEWINQAGGVPAAAAAVAPAIRALSGFASVSFSADESVAGLSADGLDALYVKLPEALSSNPSSLAVSGLGIFTIKPHGKTGRLAGKVSIVTGSAQGFGEGIARHMAAEGAFVIIADLNEELARSVAGSLCAQFGENSAVALRVNVGDEGSVEALVRETVLHYGGLDVFVSNAGILKAGSLEEMTLENFELVTKINYTAFFLCTKYAARPMKIQRRFAPERWYDILQINSKSGLDGSNKNFAYAGGKFGGIGLVQSFAKELVECGVKVNAICPGNFYDGPLWSDPQNGLFVQYLRTGKVPGAQSIEDVKNFYLSKVPMNRGCDPLDVARAIFYSVEQQCETGQAIPVTGGQIMLK